jgi:hypothetical protein
MLSSPLQDAPSRGVINGGARRAAKEGLIHESSYGSEADSGMKATLEVINAMQKDGIIAKYAIGGAVGATYYLEPSATLDIDIFVALKRPAGASRLPLAPIYEYLVSRGHQSEKEYLVIEGWPVQFLPPGDALEEEALEQAVETEVEGTRTWVITAEHLAAMALKTGRAKDFARLLEFVEAGVLDAKTLDPILERHGLLEKWEQFGVKFLGGRP